MNTIARSIWRSSFAGRASPVCHSIHHHLLSKSDLLMSINIQRVAACRWISNSQGKEIKFDVPWGHISAVEYGDPNGLPVLANHGWQDNSNSFKPLMPYIVEQSNLHVIAIDEPGCGLSSHKPPGAYYSRYEFLIEIRRILAQLGWDRVTLLGHSQGKL